MPNQPKKTKKSRPADPNSPDAHPKDWPGHAPESGEPTEAGHTHGMVIDETGTAAGKADAPDARKNPDDKAPESGRQQDAAS